MLFLGLFVPAQVCGQDSLEAYQKSKKISTKAKDLEKSLKGKDDYAIARNYESLADGFYEKNNSIKAEEYYKRALAEYVKLKRTDDVARVRRSLAKTQESQKKFDDAASNYKKAEEVSEDKSAERINAADYNRVKNYDNPAVQKEMVDEKLRSIKPSNPEESAEAYVQKADINLKNDENLEAIGNLKKALPFTMNAPEKAIEINSKIAKVYAAKNEFDRAISITDSLLQSAKDKKDVQTQIGQYQALGSIYFKKGDPEKAIAALRNAYDLSFRNGRTTQAKNSLTQLIDFYKKRGDAKKSLALYDEFFENFETLIQSDSSLIDAKTFQLTEEKIRQLEDEKKLKDELISRKNTFNYVLLGSLALLLLLCWFIVRALHAIKVKNKEIALQSLRREMNPHFIFNSLNSVNQFISQNNERDANKYLSSYSTLMRTMMENSNRDFVTLSNEIEQLKKYLDLEHMRFPDKFDFRIWIDPKLDTETTFIPNMIVQPHLENAIWHGLRYKDSKGLLLLNFGLKDGNVVVTVDDDGIGLTKSRELKTKNQLVHQSRGITNTQERMTLLNELYKKEIELSVTEKTAPQTGTVVKITFPLIDRI